MPLRSPDELLDAHHGLLIDGLTAVFGAFDPEMLGHVLPRVEWIELGGGEVLSVRVDGTPQALTFEIGDLRSVLPTLHVCAGLLEPAD